jgi:hypothetical protein
MGRVISKYSELPPEERAALYRRFAAEADRSANHTPTKECRAGYKLLAEAWYKLADRIGSQADPYLPEQCAASSRQTRRTD